ncbi:PREDICTED: PHD finger protein 7-like, partial [Apaloderma vittatum]|uniref:PHD finger protein 7-like n=1 Tax=Apaloderma vittatum TaxID=57397 RepID=UPI0005219946
AFCGDHSPRQKVEAVPEKGTCCIICQEALDDDHPSFCTLVCPTCQHAWFHRRCVQRQAMCAGRCFQCPLCLDRQAFKREMLRMGIHVPNWPWQLLLCCSCAAEGTHRGCSHLGTSAQSWECEGCAGPGA